MPATQLKIIFWGTPQAAVPFLEHLLKDRNVLAVVTQPDKPANRGQALQKSPVKILAEKHGIPVIQPPTLKDPAFAAQIAQLKPDLGIVVAYGRILPKEVISAFPRGIYNIHFSLLPDLRGAAPIQWAILRGLRKTGVCSFKIAETLDSGEIMSVREIQISPEDNSVTLERKLIPPGIETLAETLMMVEKGTSSGKPQEGTPSAAPLIKKEDARISWQAPADEIDRKIRALIRLGAFCRTPVGKTLKLLEAKPLKDSGNQSPGTVASIDGKLGFVVKCGSGSLLIRRVRPEGKNEMDAWSFLQGHRLKVGDKFE